MILSICIVVNAILLVGFFTLMAKKNVSVSELQATNLVLVVLDAILMFALWPVALIEWLIKRRR